MDRIEIPSKKKCDLVSYSFNLTKNTYNSYNVYILQKILQEWRFQFRKITYQSCIFHEKKPNWEIIIPFKPLIATYELHITTATIGPTVCLGKFELHPLNFP